MTNRAAAERLSEAASLAVAGSNPVPCHQGMTPILFFSLYRPVFARACDVMRPEGRPGPGRTEERRKDMDEMKLELPWIGSPEAAVAGIESLIFHAIGGEKVCPPTRLRYWLEAYYQARKTADAVRGTPQEIQVDQFGFEKEDDGAAVSAPP